MGADDVNRPNGGPHEVAMGKPGTTPIRVIGPSDVQQLRQIFAPVQLLYAISAGISIPKGISAGGAGIITSITETTTVDGPIIFTGSGVTQSGQTFTFPGGNSVTLASTFTIPAVGSTGTMTVTGAYQFLQDLATLFIANGTTNDQQPYVAQVISGGGTTSLVVETVSLGTYAAAGTIASGTVVTWGSTPSVTGPTPTIVNYGQAGGTGITSMPITLSASPTVGNRMVAYVSCSAGQTMYPPSGWNVLDSPTSTTAGLLDVTMASWFRDVQSGDGATYTWTCSGGGLQNGWIGEISGAAVGLMQHGILSWDTSESPVSPTIVPSSPNSFVQATFCVRNSAGFTPSTGWTRTYFVKIASSGEGLLSMQSPTNNLRSNTAINGTGSTGDGYIVAAILAFPPAAAAGASGSVNSVSGITPIVVTGTSSAPIVGLNAPLGPSYGGTGLASPGPSTYPLSSTGSAWTGGAQLMVGGGGTGLTSPGPSTWVLTSTGANWTPAPVTVTGAITSINSQTGPAVTVTGAQYVGVSTLTNNIEVFNTGVWSITGPSYTASATGIVFTGPNVLQTAPNTFYISVAGAAGGGGGGGGVAFDAAAKALFSNYYPMNETSGTAVVDAVGGSNGTYHGTVTLAAALLCRDGEPCPQFDGASGYASFPDPTSSGTDFTIMIGFMLSPTTTFSFYPAIANNYDGTGKGCSLYLNTSGYFVGYLEGTSGTPSTTVPAFGVKHLAFITYHSGSAKVYIDGMFMETISGTYAKPADGFAVGTDANLASGTYINAVLGKFGIAASTALSQAQVESLTATFFS